MEALDFGQARLYGSWVRVVMLPLVKACREKFLRLAAFDKVLQNFYQRVFVQLALGLLIFLSASSVKTIDKIGVVKEGQDCRAGQFCVVAGGHEGEAL